TGVLWLMCRESMQVGTGFYWSFPRVQGGLEHAPRGCVTGDTHPCARGDLNPHVRRHWNLNPARLPIPPLARDGTTVQTVPGVSAIAKHWIRVLYPRVTPPGTITIG